MSANNTSKSIHDLLAGMDSGELAFRIFALLRGLSMKADRPRIRLLFLLVPAGFFFWPTSGSAAVASQEQSIPKTRHGLAPAIGPYRLDMKTSEVTTLVELTPAEKRALITGIEFKNEQVYHAPNAEFAGVTWDVVLGAVDNRVYKISAMIVLQNREQRDAIWRKVNGQLRAQLGTPASTATTVLTWDTEDGNVIMNRTEASQVYAIVLTLTSRAARGFTRNK